jgi:hypothetical protein
MQKVGGSSSFGRQSARIRPRVIAIAVLVVLVLVVAAFGRAGDRMPVPFPLRGPIVCFLAADHVRCS